MEFCIWIDADGCPAVAHIVATAQNRPVPVPVVIVKNIHHNIHVEGARVVTVDSGRDCADFYIVNHIQKGDLVITQDHGLAAMLLARYAYVMNPYGKHITQDNIGELLDRRHMNQELRRKHKQHAGAKARKRTPEDDRLLIRALIEFLDFIESGE